MEKWRAEKRQQLAETLAAARTPDEEAAHDIERQQHQVDAQAESDRLHSLTQFQCHICGWRSEAPLKEDHFTQAGERTMWSTTDWHQPGDLFRCRVCGEWTCAADLVEGVCLDHA